MQRFRFLPTEEEFFGLFDDIARALIDAAAALHDLITDYTDVDHKTRGLREMEKRVDVATRTICEQLNTSFVTPIDREDIHQLAITMDSVLDYIEASADRMKLYGVEEPRVEAAELSAILIESTRQIRTAVHEVANLREIDSVLKPCVVINELENQADQVLRRALARLFKEETRPLEVAKWQEIFFRLEIATDKCEDVANVLESIVVKNA